MRCDWINFIFKALHKNIGLPPVHFEPLVIKALSIVITLYFQMIFFDACAFLKIELPLVIYTYVFL